jgi:hypothetical protein
MPSFRCTDSIAPANSSRGGAANTNKRVRDGTAFVALCAKHLGQQEAAGQLADTYAARVLRLRPPGPKAMT